ncbi:MAG: PTS sugar transporter subunit IIA [Salinarimonadaceae bacterium]|nr:MAG: PTS sugar transporter subunit IIA [Salinarimonadaceae bacterium]
MTFLDRLAPTDVHLDVDAKSAQEALAFLATKAAAHGGAAVAFTEALTSREKLGSTGLGRGVALPHAIVPGLDAPILQFARLAAPIDFAAPDGEPVDIFLMLLVPEQAGGEKLKSLSACARSLRRDACVAGLRAATEVSAVLSILQAPEPSA